MTLETFINLIFDPRTIFGGSKPKQAWYCSLIFAAATVTTLTLSNYVAFQSELNGMLTWVAASMLFFIILLAAAFFYLPLIHLLAERFMVQSRVSDLIIYSGFALSPLMLALPLAFLSRGFRLGPVFYFLAVLVISVKIFINIVSGVSENYKISRGRALWFTVLPSMIAVLLPLFISILGGLLIIYG
jgi:hypothetical protein